MYIYIYINTHTHTQSYVFSLHSSLSPPIQQARARSTCSPWSSFILDGARRGLAVDGTCIAGARTMEGEWGSTADDCPLYGKDECSAERDGCEQKAGLGTKWEKGGAGGRGMKKT